MAKRAYHVTGVVVGSKYLGTFEANSKKEAKEMALASDAIGVTLCHHCADQCEDPAIEKVCVERAPD